jgi:uncharacterized oligopeptide transporter (OPT) family protein
MSAPSRALPDRVPGALEWPALAVYVSLAAGSAAVCAQINLRLGITPNTAVIGVIVAISLGRTAWPLFRSPERQVMVETATSAGGFAGANIALVSLAVLHLLGLEHLVLPLVGGVAAGMVLDIALAAKLFGSRAFPAEGPWPDGEAVGRVIQAGDEGGTLARQLLQGIAAGVVGRALTFPMAGVGIAFIGNPVALAALATGLIVRGNGSRIGLDLAGSSIPHGIMIGAGLVQVGQTAGLIWRVARGGTSKATNACVEPPSAPASARARDTNGPAGLASHALLFMLVAVALAATGGLWQGMGLGRLAAWVAFAGVAALIHTIIVGYCAMLSGWFPSFAVAIALILVAALLRFPVDALALVAGFILSTGPQFADLGYDLKSGWIIRGRGHDETRELAGRHQQVVLQQVGGLAGIVTVWLASAAFWRLGLVPPMSKVVAATIGLVASPGLARQLLAGAAVGAAVQAAGGGRRAVGLLLATGLLLDNAPYGYALAIALVARAWIGPGPMAIRAPGLVAGDGLAGFIDAVLRVFYSTH